MSLLGLHPGACTSRTGPGRRPSGKCAGATLCWSPAHRRTAVGNACREHEIPRTPESTQLCGHLWTCPSSSPGSLRMVRRGDCTEGLGSARRCSQHCLLSGCAAAAGHPPHTGAVTIWQNPFPGNTITPVGGSKTTTFKREGQGRVGGSEDQGHPRLGLCKGLCPAPHRHCWPGSESALLRAWSLSPGQRQSRSPGPESSSPGSHLIWLRVSADHLQGHQVR